MVRTKNNRNNRHRAVNNERSQIGSVTVEQVDAKIEALNKRFDDLLSVVKDVVNMTGKVASEVKRSVSSEKTLDADKISTQAVPERNFKLDVTIVEEFHNLKQSYDVASYQEKFEKIREALVAMNYGFTEDYFIYSFLSGLKEEIRCLVWETKPETLNQAYNLARLHEIAIELKEEKEKLGSPATKITGEDTLPYDSMDLVSVFTETKRGFAGERPLSFICSNNAKYSVLDIKTAIVLGCKIEEAEPLIVRFAFGVSQAISRFKTRFQFSIDGHEFETDMRIVNLGLDMVLGIDWMIHHHVLFNRDDVGKRFLLPL